MKQNLCKIFALTFLLAIVFSATAWAAENNMNEDVGLVLYSQACPLEAEEYAQEAYVRLIQSAVDDGSLVVTGNVSLGTPFTILESQSDHPVYYFPIISNNRFIATLRVYIDGVLTEESGETIYTGILSEYLASELNELYKESNGNSTIFLYVDNGNIMAQTENSMELLIPSVKGNLPTNLQINILPTDIQAVSINDVIDSIKVSNIQPMSSSSANLNLSIIETQGNNSWCAAYTTAAIIRYLNGSKETPTAKELMNMTHNNPTANNSMSPSEVLEVAQSYGFDPIYKENTLGSSTVFAQIDAYKPLYVGVKSNISSTGHAMVLRGYNKNTDTYSVWNPWYTYYETMDMITKEYVAASTETFTWYRTIYDW